MSKANIKRLLREASKIDVTLKYYHDYGVGKKMGSCIYVHLSSEHVLPFDRLKLAKDSLVSGLDLESAPPYQVVRYDVKSGDFAFIESEDFDVAAEPSVGNSYLVRKDGSVSISKKKENTKIYHHKWQFVAQDYDGFNVSESIARSILWKEIVGKDRSVSSRIGYSKYWNLEIVPKINLAVRSGKLKKILSNSSVSKI